MIHSQHHTIQTELFKERCCSIQAETAYSVARSKIPGAVCYIVAFCFLLITSVLMISANSPSPALAATTENIAESTDTASYTVSVSSEGQRAVIEDTPYAADEFSRANKGTNRTIDEVYRGYHYIQPHENMATLVDMGTFVVVFIPQEQLDDLGLSLEREQDREALEALLRALDDNAAGGNTHINPDIPWYFTSEEVFSCQDVVFSFNQPVEERYYTFIIGSDGSDISENDTNDSAHLNHASFAVLSSSETTSITQAATGMAALSEFFQKLDLSPLWVTLKTTVTAIVIIFILGILAAWWSLRLPDRWQNMVDAIFTIPMVLPPTVCGFLLLLALGSNSPVGQWFNTIGFPLIFSWPATVIAAVVVAFPLMYRSARGAFESLNPDMLDAARTLGWGEARVFFRLMLPLAWSSIAAGTMLAFARALGEFGATLFLAGNYVGITRTIPIAIYFEWMGGNTDVAIFWTIIVILLSFLVIFALNVWSRHTTRYRRKEVSDELEG